MLVDFIFHAHLFEKCVSLGFNFNKLQQVFNVSHLLFQTCNRDVVDRCISTVDNLSTNTNNLPISHIICFPITSHQDIYKALTLFNKVNIFTNCEEICFP